MKAFWSIMVVIMTYSGLTAQAGPEEQFSQAKKAQLAGDYEKAKELYEGMLESGYRSEALYHNLALIALEQGQTGSAVLQYERCFRTVPGAVICRQNLNEIRKGIDSYEVRFASVKTAVKINELVSIASSTLWGLLSIAFMMLAGVLFYYRGGFRFGFSWIPILGISLLLLLSASRRYYLESNNDFAIVMHKGVELRQGPDKESKKLYPLQDGSRVKVLSKDGNWSRVLLLNRDIGWLRSEVLSPI